MMHAKVQTTAAAVSGAASPAAFTKLLCRRMPMRVKPSQAAEMPDATADPDGLYTAVPLQRGIIQKRLIERQIKKSNKEFKMAIEMAESDDRKEILLRRESRVQPENREELVEYFLETLAEDMDFEVARHRLSLDKEFFAFLDKCIGEARFLPELPGEGEAEAQQDRLGELTVLKQYLMAAVTAVDTTVASMTSAKDRMTKLLTSKDKKQMILDMAAANEIDQSLMDLLMTNVQAARDAGQEDAAKFMEKVMQACAKFFIQANPPPAAPEGVAGPATSSTILGAKAPAPSGGNAPRKLILPGQRDSGLPVSAPNKAPGSGSGLIIDPKIRPI